MAENNNSPQEFTELLDSIVQTAIFDANRWGKYTPSQLQQLYFSGNDMNIITVHSAKPLVDERLLGTLIERVRSALSDHIIPGEDSIPNKLVPLMGGMTELTRPKFTETLVRAAAILGPAHATQMFSEWAEGKPIRYWRHAVLDGVSVEQSLELNGAIRIETLPNSSDQIPHHVPFHAQDIDYSATMYTSRVKLSVAYETTFLSQLPQEGAFVVDHKHTSIGIADFTLDGFCESLALASNHYVSWINAWSDCGDWDVFRIGGSSQMRRAIPDYGKANLSHDHLVQACELFALLQSKGSKAKRLRIAISRWIQSKRDGATLTDKFIDLRIVLEALYLADASSESRFRVSNHGAWHLGEDFSKRRTYQKDLRDAYDLASRVVHAGEIDYTESNLEILRTAQDLCREGILKRLRESEEPNWNELILGKES